MEVGDLDTRGKTRLHCIRNHCICGINNIDVLVKKYICMKNIEKHSTRVNGDQMCLLYKLQSEIPCGIE